MLPWSLCSCVQRSSKVAVRSSNLATASYPTTRTSSKPPVSSSFFVQTESALTAARPSCSHAPTCHHIHQACAAEHADPSLLLHCRFYMTTKLRNPHYPPEVRLGWSLRACSATLCMKACCLDDCGGFVCCGRADKTAAHLCRSLSRCHC